MAFLQSWMLWGLLAVGVPIAIHLIHRRKARRVPFPAIEFILRSRKAVAKKFRIKQLILLALRCLLVAAAAVAAARPLFPGRDAAIGPSGGPAAVAICIDQSLSMRAHVGTAPDATAFKAATDAALALVHSLGPDVEAVIVPFADDARTIPAAPTADKTALEGAIRSLSAGYGTTNVARALDTAAAALSNTTKPSKLVYLFTDAAQPGWHDVTPRDATQSISWRVVDVTSHATPNLAAASLDVHEDAGGAAARAEVQSFSELATPGAAVELSVNDRPAGRNFVDLAPGASAASNFTLAAPPAGLNVAVARVAPDALPDDDARWAVFRGRARVRTLLVDGDPKRTIRDAETFYLERALAPSREATATLAPVVVDPEGLARAQLSQYDVIVLANVGTLPPTLVSALRRWVSDGGGLFFTAGDRVDAEEANANFGDLLPMRLRGSRSTRSEHSEGGATSAAQLSLAPPTGKHPVTTALDASTEDVFSSTKFATVELFEGGSASSGANAILRFSDGTPALVEKTLGRGRIAFLASTIDRDWTNLPISTLYLPLMRRMVRYLSGELGDQGTAAVLVGHAIKVEVGEPHKSIRVEGPEGFTPQVVPVVDGTLEITPPLPGVYRLAREDGTPDERLSGRGFAANVDTAESDLRKVSRAELARIFAGVDFDTSGGIGETGTGSHGAVPDEPMWGMLLGIGIAALVLEGVVTGV